MYSSTTYSLKKNIVIFPSVMLSHSEWLPTHFINTTVKLHEKVTIHKLNKGEYKIPFLFTKALVY